MDREEMRTVLDAAIKQASPESQVAIPEALLDDIMKYGDVHEAGTVRREHVLASVKKYKSLVKTHKMVRDLLSRHDSDKDGSISPQELLPLLKEVAPPPHKHADMADVEFVMESADKDKSGTLEMHELEAAVGMWLEMVPLVAPEPKASSACSIL